MFIRRITQLRDLLRPTAAISLIALIIATSFTADQVEANLLDQDPSGAIVIRVVMVEDTVGDPRAAGEMAAKKLLAAMGDTAPKAVLLSECFEDREYKEPMLKGVCSVISPELVYGGATYGSFTQDGCTDLDAVALVGIGGIGIEVTAALVTQLGTAKLTFEEHKQQIEQQLHTAGEKLARQLTRSDQDQLAILVADAHSPKNQYLVEGLQKVLGDAFPITGGSANKNAGQTFIYYQGKVYRDSALVLMLSGDFRASLAGRKAMDNDAVIATAREAARAAIQSTEGQPLAVLAFNCAGRRGKLNDPAEELAAIQSVLGKELPMFGCYCAGEVGPLDVSEKQSDALSGGAGWHVMFTVLSR